jgi:hypothetical protein
MYVQLGVSPSASLRPKPPTTWLQLSLIATNQLTQRIEGALCM